MKDVNFGVFFNVYRTHKLFALFFIMISIYAKSLGFYK